VGRVSSHSRPEYGLGGRRKLPNGVRAKPRPKMFLCIFQVTKKPSGTPFSVFWSDGDPPNVAGPGKLSPIPPLSTGLRLPLWLRGKMVSSDSSEPRGRAFETIFSPFKVPSTVYIAYSVKQDSFSNYSFNTNNFNNFSLCVTRIMNIYDRAGCDS